MPDLPLEAPPPASAAEGQPRSATIAGAGAVVTATLASLCCVGPLLFVTLGVGAGWASTFEPLRPVFAGLTVALLGLGFYAVYGQRVRPNGAEANCGPEHSCPTPRHRRRNEVILWVATVAALVLLSFPTWSKILV